MDSDDRCISLKEERRRMETALNKEVEGLGGIPRKLCDIYLTVFNFVGSYFPAFDREDVDPEGTPEVNPFLFTVTIIVLFFGGWFAIVNAHGYSDLTFLLVPLLVIFLLVLPGSILIRRLRKSLIRSAARTNSWIGIYKNRLREIDKELITLN